MIYTTKLTKINSLGNERDDVFHVRATARALCTKLLCPQVTEIWTMAVAGQLDFFFFFLIFIKLSSRLPLFFLIKYD